VPQHVGVGDHARFVGVSRAVSADVLGEREGDVAADVVAPGVNASALLCDKMVIIWIARPFL